METEPVPRCVRGHRIKTGRDRTASGHCREGSRINHRNYRVRRRANLALILKMLEQGWSVDPQTLEAEPVRRPA